MLLVISSTLKFAKFSQINIFEHCLVNNVSINKLVQSGKKYMSCTGFCSPIRKLFLICFLLTKSKMNVKFRLQVVTGSGRIIRSVLFNT